ncbi:MAG: hypothetical protein H0T89_03315 [Deltaproteobacteria bacterium]|nr:hypothetical protein [Deltaproteobacteria bacterium]
MRVSRAWLVVAAACSGGDRASSPPITGSAPAPVADPWAEGAASIPDPPKLELVHPGDEPRRIARYTPIAVTRTIRIATSHVGGTLEAELQVAWSCAPPAPCTYQLAKFHIAGDPDPTTFAKIAESIRGTVEIAADGTATIRPATLMKTMPSTTELMRIAIARFPAEPIGVGARWRLVEHDLQRTYTAVALTDRGATLDVELIYAPSKDSTSDGKLRLDIDLGDPFAKVTGTQHTVITFDAKVRMDPIEQTMAIAIETLR